MKLSIPTPQSFLYFLADSHLDYSMAPYQEFNEMLKKLESPEAIVLMGDLFKVWLAMPKYWADINREVMACLSELREKGVKIFFVIGNREVLLPRKWTAKAQATFPFNELIPNDCILEWGKLRYGIEHGDLINFNDEKYLRWRKIARGHAFEWFFRLLPAPMARRLAHKIEEGLSKTNQEFKITFPQQEIEHFAKTVLPNVDHYFVGHFHEDKTITIPGHPGAVHVVPDWLSKRAVLQIDRYGNQKKLYYQKGELVETPI